MGRDKEEEKGRGNGEISPGKVYRQDPSFLEWCTEIARYLCQNGEGVTFNSRRRLNSKNLRRQPSVLMFRNQYLECTPQVCERALGDRKKKGFHKNNHRLDGWID